MTTYIHALARLLALVTVVVGTLLVVVWLVQRRMIYFPSGGCSRAGASRPPAGGGRELCDRRRVDAERLVCAVRTAGRGDGHRLQRQRREPRVLIGRPRGLAAGGMAVLLFDYRGYGDNPGSPSEEGLALDARAARRYVLSRADVDTRPARLLRRIPGLGSGRAARGGASRRGRHSAFALHVVLRHGAAPLSNPASPGGCCGIAIRRLSASRVSDARCS